MAMSSGSMNRIIGPTRPMLGSPLASSPKPPIPPTGVQPDSMKNAVMKPQAMKAAMFGMIMPDRKVPNFWTATRTLPVLLVLAPASAFTAICASGVDGPERGVLRATRSVAAVACRSYRTVWLRTRSSGSIDRSTSQSRGAGPMRVVRFYAPEDVRIEDAPEPSAGPGELVIRVRNCSTCGTDAKTWRSGHPDLRPPRVLGHEVAGVVAEVGEGAAGWAVGDRVQVIAAVPDGSCHECRRGGVSVCPNPERIRYHHDGGFAQLMRGPAQ